MKLQLYFMLNIRVISHSLSSRFWHCTVDDQKPKHWRPRYCKELSLMLLYIKFSVSLRYDSLMWGAGNTVWISHDPWASRTLTYMLLPSSRVVSCYATSHSGSNTFQVVGRYDHCPSMKFREEENVFTGGEREGAPCGGWRHCQFVGQKDKSQSWRPSGAPVRGVLSLG